MLSLIGVSFLALIVSAIGTEVIRRYALHSSMVDVPNERSSHSIPTPRGGGIAIAICINLALIILAIAIPEQRRAAIGILGGGLLIAAIGLLDDRFGLSAKLRLVVHVVAAGWLLACQGGAGDYSLAGMDVTVVMLPIAVLYLVWCTNLFNFMDGIDGFAGSQALVAAVTFGAMGWLAGDGLIIHLMTATAGASAGFLLWNWPPAKIFMGDCGSGFLGFLFGAVTIVGHKQGTIPVAAGVTVMLVFLADATLTLFRRIHAGETWYKPHRSHAYQLATQLGGSHLQVTLAANACFVVAGMLALSVWNSISTGSSTSIAFVGVGTYAIALVGVWAVINSLFAGRSHALASITQVRSVEPGQEKTAKFYLHFRRIQSRISQWSSVMPMKDLLTEATGVASELGYNVTHDWLDGCGGGRCEVAGEKWILLDFDMSRQDQTRQILLAIQNDVVGMDSLSADLKSALHEAVRPTSTQSRAA